MKKELVIIGGAVVLSALLVFQSARKSAPVKPDVTGGPEVMVSVDDTVYNAGSKVKITFVNTHDVSLRVKIYDYEVEKYEPATQTWSVVKLLPRCPCGAMCKLAVDMEIPPGETKETEWDLRSGECDGQNENAQIVQAGTYRIKVKYLDSSGQENMTYSDVFGVRS